MVVTSPGAAGVSVPPDLWALLPAVVSPAVWAPLPSAADPGALPAVLLQAVNDAAIEIPSSNIPILFVSLMVPPPILIFSYYRKLY